MVFAKRPKRQTIGRIRKADVILGIVLLLFGGILFFLISFSGDIGGEAEVAQDGKQIGVYRLAEPRTIDLKSDIPAKERRNRLEIKDGEIKMAEANCPDQYCVKHRAISHTGESIICLPNKVVVTITKGEERKLDAITN